jgi:flavin reductase (DIM6/NTAB) family NADH-FMN oxidoreductase RutF
MPIDEYRFRQTMGHFASGVTVVTARYEERLYGMTVSSFSSLSLNPPLVLICIDNRALALPAFVGSGCFAVNILSKYQEHLSRRFATPAENKFIGLAWSEGMFGIPLLDGALAHVECRLTETFPGGDHTILVGEVVNALVHEGLPLLYYRGGYHELL